MSSSVSIAKAKADFAALLARAESGEEITIMRNGRAVARLSPPPKRPRKQKLVLGDLAHLHIADDLTLPEEMIESFYHTTFPE